MKLEKIFTERIWIRFVKIFPTIAVYDLKDLFFIKYFESQMLAHLYIRDLSASCESSNVEWGVIAIGRFSHIADIGSLGCLREFCRALEKTNSERNFCRKFHLKLSRKKMNFHVHIEWNLAYKCEVVPGWLNESRSAGWASFCLWRLCRRRDSEKTPMKGRLDAPPRCEVSAPCRKRRKFRRTESKRRVPRCPGGAQASHAAGSRASWRKPCGKCCTCVNDSVLADPEAPASAPTWTRRLRILQHIRWARKHRRWPRCTRDRSVHRSWSTARSTFCTWGTPASPSDISPECKWKPLRFPLEFEPLEGRCGRIPPASQGN